MNARRPWLWMVLWLGLAWSVSGGNCMGYLDGEPEGPGLGTGDCEPECPSGTVCRDGECIDIAIACEGVACAPGTHCEMGTCVADEACEGVVCSNAGEACIDGICVAGAADNDSDGYPARDDCNDNDDTIHPDALDLCNGLDEDCDAATTDGDHECPGYCCGPTPACRECCTGDQCGPGEWTCDSYSCNCDQIISP